MLFLTFLALCAAVAADSSPKVSLNETLTNAVSGDVIWLEPVIYSGQANCNIELRNKNLTLISETSETVIDCGGRSRCLVVSDGSSVRIVGVTLRNGNALGFGDSSIRTAKAVSGSRLFFFDVENFPQMYTGLYSSSLAACEETGHHRASGCDDFGVAFIRRLPFAQEKVSSCFSSQPAAGPCHIITGQHKS